MHETAKPDRLYRSRHGVLLGVCKGLADYLDVGVFWVRLVAVLLFLFSTLWPVVGIYLLAAVLMKPEPVLPFHDEADEEFYLSYATSRHAAVHRLNQTYQKLHRRLARLESLVTDREFDWHRRLREEGPNRA